MTRMFFAAAAFACLALQGCAGNRVIPTGVEAHCNSAVCQIRLDLDCSVSPCSGGADKDPLHIHGAQRFVVWMLVSHDYRFCPALGDGVTVVDPNQEFTDGYATDQNDGTRGGNGPGLRNFKWTDANSFQGHHKYHVIFHDKGCTGPAHTWDPEVINDM